MIVVRKKWQNVLFIIIMQMLILNFIDLFFGLPKEVRIISGFFGVMAITLSLAPQLGFYEYKEDKEKKKQLQKFCNGLSSLKNKLENTER